jgi:hypothetical protein
MLAGVCPRALFFAVQLLNFKVQTSFFNFSLLHSITVSIKLCINRLGKQGARETKGTLPWAHHGEYAMQILGRSLWVLTSAMALGWLSFLMDAANTVRNLLARHACSFPGCQTHPLIPPIFLHSFHYNTRSAKTSIKLSWNRGLNTRLYGC